MQTSALEIGVAILATWRLTHLLQAEDGPWDLLVRFRRLFGRSVVGALLDCFYCLSVWVAVPFALWAGTTWLEELVLWPAISGGACLLERLTSREESDEIPSWQEDPIEAPVEEPTLEDAG